jgi:hypothetical protein
LIVLHHSGGRSVGQKLVLDALITHALRHLRISERMLGTTPPTLSALFTRSQCTLVSLKVGYTAISETEYRTAFPSIENIIVPF